MQSDVIEGRYIVVYEGSIRDVAAQTDRRERRLGFRIAHRCRHALYGFVGWLSRAQVRELRDDPVVDFVSADRRVEASAQVPLATANCISGGRQTTVTGTARTSPGQPVRDDHGRDAQGDLREANPTITRPRSPTSPRRLRGRCIRSRHRASASGSAPQPLLRFPDPVRTTACNHSISELWLGERSRPLAPACGRRPAADHQPAVGGRSAEPAAGRRSTSERRPRPRTTARGPRTVRLRIGHVRLRKDGLVVAGRVVPRARRKARILVEFNRPNGEPAEIETQIRVNPRGRFRVHVQVSSAVRGLGAWVAVTHPRSGAALGQRRGQAVGGSDIAAHQRSTPSPV